MKRTAFGLGVACCAASIAWAGAAQAQVVVAALEPQETGGNRAMIPIKIELSETKPDNLKTEPTYAYKPKYGVITLGDAKENRIVVALETVPAPGRPKVYVDSNGNGVLTDDPAVKLAPLPITTSQKGTKGVSAASENSPRLGATVPVVARYNVPGRGGVLPGTIQLVLWDGDLTYNREYGRVGVLKLPTRNVKIALVDQTGNARFDDFKHEEEQPAKVTVLVDRNGDGTFDPKREAFDAAEPFRVAGGVYRVSGIDVRGVQLTLKRTERKVTSTVSAGQLKRGGKVIDFDVETFDGKSVAFPDDYKGKVVLLDFWAVWCPPCVEEVPNIVRVYEQFHKQGFEILGISLDQEKKEQVLEDFLTENKMTWKQVYDGGYWKAEVAQMYGINSIPMAYLVDGDTGKILAMGDELRGEGLAIAVEKALLEKKLKGN